MAHPWLTHEPSSSILSRFEVPAGFSRPSLNEHSFAAWLRGLPLLAGTPDVLLYNGEKKRNQSAQIAVVDIDIGERDLQQCADAVIRLRAEYLFSHNQYSDLAFHYTSGDLSRFEDFADGKRVVLAGRRAKFEARQKPLQKSQHATLRAWLDELFMYAGSLSLSQELKTIGDLKRVEGGDVLIQGGSPGHAVLVVDVAHKDDERAFLLAQSYMPAQNIHVLQPGWVMASADEKLVTPEWTFKPALHHKRFP